MPYNVFRIKEIEDFNAKKVGKAKTITLNTINPT